MSQYSQGWSNLPPGAVKPPAQGGAAPPSGGGGVPGMKWFGYCNYTHPSKFVMQADLYTPGFSDNIAKFGPFDTQAEAQAAVDKCFAGGSSTQPPPSGTAPQPTGGGTPGVSTYFNVCYDAGEGSGRGIRQVLAQTASGAMGQVNGAVAAFGPYAGLAAAQSAADQDLQRCPGLAQSAAGCDITPLIDCKALPATLSALGVPGTPEWCQAVDTTVREIGAVGNAVFKFIDDLLNTKTRIDNIDDYLAGLTASPVTSGIVKVIRQVFCWLAPYIETLRNIITCARGWLKTIFPKCNTDATWGLIVIRSLLVTVQHLEFGTDAAIWLIARSGVNIDPLMTTIEYLIAYSCPVELVDEASVIEAWKYNTVDEGTVRCVLAAHGKQLDALRPYLDARGDKPGWREALQYARRAGFGAQHDDSVLRALGVTNPGYRAALGELFYELPTISDHLEWLRKNVFDDAYVRDFRLMEGFEERFWAKFGGDLEALGMRKEYAALHYAAHWINPAFGQQFSMVQRLRPGRVDPSLVFTRDDLLRTMQEMDVGAYFRERLEAISHPIPNLTQCLQLFQFGAIDYKELVEKLKDLGFSQSDSEIQANSAVVRTRRLNASAGHGWTPAALASAYAVGRLTQEQVRNEMQFLGFDNDAADRLMRRAEIELAIAPVKRIRQQALSSALRVQQSAYKSGIISAEQLAEVFRNAGIPDDTARIVTQQIDSAVAVSLADQQIAAFKKALLTGKATLDQISLLLDGVGIPPLRKAQLLKSWVVEAQTRAPAATAAQILKWVGMGLLDREAAVQRLVNLGWSDPDLTLLLTESLAKLGRMQAAIQRQAAKSQQAAAKAALQAAREAESTARQLRAKLRGIASRSQLQKWYKEELIDDNAFIDYMKARGYDDDSTIKYLLEAQQAKDKANAKPKAKAKPGVPSNGTATGSAGQPPAP